MPFPFQPSKSYTEQRREHENWHRLDEEHDFEVEWRDRYDLGSEPTTGIYSERYAEAPLDAQEAA